jgi:hypothetical protein
VNSYSFLGKDLGTDRSTTIIKQNVMKNVMDEDHRKSGNGGRSEILSDGEGSLGG